jgi:hypothetical protein
VSEVRVSELPPELRAKVTDFESVIKATSRDNPSREDVTELKKYLNETPQLWTVAGDITKFVQDQLIDRVSGTELIRQSVSKGIDVLRDELDYQDASRLEQLLIDQVVLCWLRLRDIEWRYTQVTSESIPISSADYWERRLNASQRRYLRACETLARVRKIIRRTPALQINIATQGGQQVNVTGDVRR